MNKLLNPYLLSGICFAILAWLFTGLFYDAEFYEPHLFLKHRPSSKVYFYSPAGMSDITMKELSPKGKAEEAAYREFTSHYWSNRHIISDILPFVMIQLALSFLCLGIMKVRQQVVFMYWHLMLHPVICILFLGLGFVLALNLGNRFPLKLLLVIPLLNYWVLTLMLSHKSSASQIPSDDLR